MPAARLGSAVSIWVLPRKLGPGRTIDRFDAVRLAVYPFIGTLKLLGLEVRPLPAVMIGIMTACVGGVIRDVRAGVPSIPLRAKTYVTAAALTAALFRTLVPMGVPVLVASTIGATVGFGLRTSAIARDLSIPAYTN